MGMEHHSNHNEDEALEHELEHKHHNWHSLSKEEKEKLKEQKREEDEEKAEKKKERAKRAKRDAEWKITEKKFLRKMFNFGFGFGVSSSIVKRLGRGKLEYAKPLSSKFAPMTESEKEYHLRAHRVSDKIGLNKKNEV